MVANPALQDYWTSPAGMLQRMLDAAAIRETDRVLDIGCGTGASTLAAARLCGRGVSVFSSATP